MTTAIRSFVFALIVVLALCSASVSAQTTPLVSGTIRDRVTNATITGVPVAIGHQECHFFLGCDFFVDATTVTNSSGFYEVAKLSSTSPNGQYVVVAGGTGFVRVIYPDQICYSGVCENQDQQIAGQITLPASDIDLRTRVAASVTGRVTRSSNGSPVAGAVTAQRIDGQGSMTLNADAEGQFRFDRLVDGDYRLEARESVQSPTGLLARAYPSQDSDFTGASMGSAAIVALASGQDFSANFQLSQGSCIEGQRLSSIDGALLSIPAELLRISPFGEQNYLRGDLGFAGGYRIDALLPGTVKIRFVNSFVPNQYRPNYFPDVESEGVAAEVALSAGACTTGVDAHLVPRQLVRGTVRDATSGLGVPGVRVAFGYYEGGFWPGLVTMKETVSDVAGNYVVQGIDAAPGRLLWTRDVDAYFSQAYFMHPPLTPVSSWTRFELPQDQTLTSMDFALHRGAFVSGTVTGRIESNYDTTVEVLDEAGVRVGSARPPGVQGVYATNPFPPGSYRLAVKPGLGSHRYAYPGVSCRGTGPGTGIPLCAVPGAELVPLMQPGEHPGYHFDIDEIDTLLKDGFE